MKARAHWLPWIPLAGLIGGLLQGLPMGGLSGCCCVPWSLFAAWIAVALIVRKAGARTEPAEGAVIGVLVGVVSGVVGGALGAAREMLGQTTGLVGPFLHDRSELFGVAVLSYVWAAFVVFLLYVLFALAFGTLGGLIGSSISKPRALLGQR